MVSLLSPFWPRHSPWTYQDFFFSFLTWPAFSFSYMTLFLSNTPVPHCFLVFFFSICVFRLRPFFTPSYFPSVHITSDVNSFPLYLQTSLVNVSDIHLLFSILEMRNFCRYERRKQWLLTVETCKDINVFLSN